MTERTDRNPQRLWIVLMLALLLLNLPTLAPAQSVGTKTQNFFRLSPPAQETPVVVVPEFQFREILGIDESSERFQFSGVLTLTWHDPREAFDPADTGVDEKIYQGTYQFNEVATSWYPEVIVANEANAFQSSGVVLRIRPDGTSKLIQTIIADVKTALNMRWFPFDRHHLEAHFKILGFDREEVVWRLASDDESSLSINGLRLPQWHIAAAKAEIMPDRPSDNGRSGTAASFIIGLDVDRKSFYIFRLVVFPLSLIVFLSFSVFWMERSSLGDRISVSFIGILTAVSYQLLVSDSIAHISYFTLIHGFMNVSFFIMCLTVVVNLVVGSLDKKGLTAVGDRVDYRCRWLFPSAYIGLNLVIVGAGLVFF